MKSLIALKKAIFTKKSATIDKVLNDNPQLFSKLSGEPQTQKMLSIITCMAIRSNIRGLLEKFAEHGLDLTNYRTINGETLLLVACQASRDISIDLIQDLHYECAEHINIKHPKIGLSPLAFIVLNSPYPGCKEIIKFFLDTGAAIHEELFDTPEGLEKIELPEHYLHQLLLNLAADFSSNQERKIMFEKLANRFKPDLNLSILSFEQKVNLLEYYENNMKEAGKIIEILNKETTGSEETLYLANIFIACRGLNYKKLAKSILYYISLRNFSEKILFCEKIADRLYKMRPQHKEITGFILKDMEINVNLDESQELQSFSRKYAFLYLRLYALDCLPLCMDIEDIIWEMDVDDKLVFMVSLMEFNQSYSNNSRIEEYISLRRERLAKRFISSISSNDITKSFKDIAQDLILELINRISMYLGDIAGTKENIIDPLIKLTQQKLEDSEKHELTTLKIDPGLLLFGGALGQQSVFGQPGAGNKALDGTFKKQSVLNSLIFGSM